MIVPPDHLVAGVGSSTFSLGGPPGGRISTNGGVIYHRHLHVMVVVLDWTGIVRLGTRAWPNEQVGHRDALGRFSSGMAMALNRPTIEIVPHLLESDLVSKIEGGGPKGHLDTRHQMVILSWMQKLDHFRWPLPPPVPSPGRSKVAGEFDTGAHQSGFWIRFFECCAYLWWLYKYKRW